MDDKMACGCCRTIRGEVIDPQPFMKVISHPLRKALLNRLYILASDNPITKEQLAKSAGVSYEKANYQLNAHLREFWKVVRREKVRGAYREYIAPKDEHAVYVNLGAGRTIYVIDPYSNAIGKLKDVGTRCDSCSAAYRKTCQEQMFRKGCLRGKRNDVAKWDGLLEDNGRRQPFTPIDYLLACTIATGFEGERCALELSQCGCQCSG
jgi:hypothetical protein